MTPDAVLAIMQRAVWTAFEATGPLLGLGVSVGMVMALVQAATQLQEPSITFVPKLAALGAGVFLFGPWVLERLTGLSTSMFSAIALVGP